MTNLTQNQILDWLNACSLNYKENRDMLTGLDADIGDADHGLNMDRGFSDVAQKLSSVSDKDIGTILKTTGMSLLSKVGGASGPLYGTFFIRAATKTMGKQALTSLEFISMLEAGVDGIVGRGKAEPNDKTMCDVWWEVIAAAKAVAASTSDVKVVIAEMSSVAVSAAEKTIPMLARKGRASYLGERSIGHQDPGATSTMLMVKTLNNVVNGA